MTEIQIFNKLHFLSPALKNEVNDFVDFLLTKQNKTEKVRKPQFGMAKGRFKISPDFDAPLEDLKDYME